MIRFFSELKILWKSFLVVFLICFLIINWNSISWIFNYKVIFQFFSGFFQEIFFQSSNQETIGNEINGEKIRKESEISERENSLEIPKIEILAPLILVEKEPQVKSALDRGVVLFPGSALPEQTGQTIILGHSAPSYWPKIKYNWIFTRISELKEGDDIFLHFNHQKYKYSVEKKIFLEKGEELPGDLTNSRNMLILISCWPPETGTRRISVVAVKN